MKKIRKNIDALIDIVIIAILMFTISMIMTDPTMRFLLIVIGCGAMFNNCKYLFDFKRRKKNKKQK